MILQTHWSYGELQVAPEEVVREIIDVLREQAEAYEDARNKG